MALDGAFLHFIKEEISAYIDARIDKIHQPSREEIVIHLRGKGYSKKLLLSAGADSPRIHFTEESFENPKTPPMFCMLLRKHLGSGRLAAVRQAGMDRILSLDFESVNELGDRVTLTLIIEIMGRHSNIILVGQDHKIIDAIKRVDEEMSRVRQVLPGMLYHELAPQDKLNLLTAQRAEIEARLSGGRDEELSKALVKLFQGISPVLAREIAGYATRYQERRVSELGADDLDRLMFFCGRLRKMLLENTPEPTIALEQNGKPREFSFLELKQYGHYLLTKRVDSCSELLDRFYAERDRIERMKQRSNDLLKLLMNLSERTERKIAVQTEELASCANRELYKTYGDLLSANLYQLKKGQTAAVLVNYYDEAQAEISIPLDPSLTPVQNAQKYYREYRKAATAENMLTTLIEQARDELVYLESVFDAVSRTDGESELLEIRQELSEQGYLKHYKNKNKMLKAQPPMRFCSSDGYTILCGRNNKQNDRLTLRDAKNFDLWLHVHNMPGSHVIVQSQGGIIPNKTIEEACVIAAYNSKARDSAQVSIDYTLIKNVKKPNGAKPGMVIFTDYQTAYVTPDEALVKKLSC